MTVTLVVSEAIAETLREIASLKVETAGVLQVSVLSSGGGVRLIAQRLSLVPEGAYSRRESNGLRISADGYVPFLSNAETANATCIWMHTHPGLGASPRPSDHDIQVDAAIAPVFRLRTGSSYYGAIIVSPGHDGLAFTGHFDQDGDSVPIDRIWEVGSRFRLTHSIDNSEADLTAAFDRNVRAFGPAIQRTLADLSVAIVGCGGTGSAVAEQLVRLGVRRLRLIDPDLLSDSNITRVYGSSAADVGRPKVDVLRDHLTRIRPDIRCDTERSMITVRTTARRLADCDIAFGCTDDNAGRLVLSRLATYLLLPVVDIGVLLSSAEGGSLTGIDARVTLLVPGSACLVCRGRVDLRRAAAELLTPDERTRLADEGYAPALGNVEPAVISFTSLVGAVAVSELLERLIGFGPAPRPSEILVRYHDREISTNIALPNAGHYCDQSSGKWGLADAEPFLEQIWQA